MLRVVLAAAAVYEQGLPENVGHLVDFGDEAHLRVEAAYPGGKVVGGEGVVGFLPEGAGVRASLRLSAGLTARHGAAPAVVLP